MTLLLCGNNFCSSLKTVEISTVERNGGILQNRKAYLRQFLSIIPGFILIIDVGAQLAWSSPALPHLTSEESEFSVTNDQGAWLASVDSLLAIIGYMISSLLINRIGRRYTIQLFGVLHLLSWILINLAYNFTSLIIARCAAGLSLGGTYSFLPPYIGEVTEERIRGTHLLIDRIGVNLGVFLINTLGAYLEYETMNLVMVLLPIMAVFLFPFMLDSPFFYMMKGQEVEAIKTVMKLPDAKKPEVVMAYIRRMKRAVESQNSENSSIQKLINDRGSRKAIIVIFLAFSTYAFSGSIATQAYTQIIFKKSGSSLAPKYAAVIIAGIQMFSVLPSTQLIYFWGRRPVYLFSGIASAISLGTVGLFFFFKDYLQTDVSSVSWLPLVGLILYQFMCNSGISTIPTVLAEELLSVKVKEVAIMIVLIVTALFLFATKMILPLLNNTFGIYTTFWMFSSVCFIGSIIIVYITPETKGKNLEEVLELMRR